MLTEILCINDRSGSMQSIRSDAEGSFNAFIDRQKQIPGEARVTLAIFDDAYEVVYKAEPIEHVPHYVLVPRGCTALFDAIGRTLNEQGKRIAQEKWAQVVIVSILTDGMENASKEYTLDRVKEMIAHAESQGWKFIWQAANLDALQLARSLGSHSVMVNSVTADAFGMASTQAYSSTAVESLRSGMSEGEAALAATEAVNSLKDKAEAAKSN